MVRALASHQCGLGSNLRPGIICGLSLLLVLILAPRVFQGVSWCCGNHCWLAIVLWCGYCLLSFESFVLRHLVIATSATSRNDRFSPGSPVVLPPQKPTLVNSNSIWDPRATLPGLSVARLFKCYPRQTKSIYFSLEKYN